MLYLFLENNRKQYYSTWSGITPVNYYCINTSVPRYYWACINENKAMY